MALESGSLHRRARPRRAGAVLGRPARRRHSRRPSRQTALRTRSSASASGSRAPTSRSRRRTTALRPHERAFDDQRARVERALARCDTSTSHTTLTSCSLDRGNELHHRAGNRFLEGCSLVGAVSCDARTRPSLLADAPGRSCGTGARDGDQRRAAIPRSAGRAAAAAGTAPGAAVRPASGPATTSEAGPSRLGAARLGTDEHGVLIADPDGHEHRLLPSR
jgi:hypothetical protein